MNNFIVTITSIALVAIGLLTGVYYGGIAYENAQINAVATTVLNEAQQILNAERLWSTNNNQPDISGMGTQGASGTGMSMLVSSKGLTEWPPVAGTFGQSTTLSGIAGPQPNSGSVTTGTFDAACYNYQGYIGKIYRVMFSYNNSNYVMYSFGVNSPYVAPCTNINGHFTTNDADVSQANHPVVKIAKLINAALNQVPPNAYLTASIGLPRPPTTSSYVTSSQVYDTSTIVVSNARGVIDSNGTFQSNYCYLVGNATPSNTSAQSITCVFGPS